MNYVLRLKSEAFIRVNSVNVVVITNYSNFVVNITDKNGDCIDNYNRPPSLASFTDYYSFQYDIYQAKYQTFEIGKFSSLKT